MDSKRVNLDIIYFFNNKCDATWSSEIYDTFKGYKDGKTKSISTGYGIEFGPSINADVNTPGTFESRSHHLFSGIQLSSTLFLIIKVRS